MRKVREWIGATDDSTIPARVRLRVFERHNGICHISGRKILPHDKWDLDHIVSLINGGMHVEHNLAPALRDRHRIKTALDVAEKAKVSRVRKKHLGIIKTPRYKIKSRGFAKAEPQRSASRPLKRHQDSQP